MKKPFEWHFPLFSSAVRHAPFVALGFGLLAIGALIIEAKQVAFGLMLISVGLLGLWSDRRWFAVWPIPPVAWFSSVCIFAGGVGPILLWLTGADFQGGDLELMQMGMLAGSSCFFIVWASFRPSAARCPSIPELIIDNLQIRRSLVGACFLFFAFGIAETIVGAISGASDRGMAGESAAYEVFGYWSYFVAFNRLTPLAFLLAPLAWRFGNAFGRLFIVAAAIFIVFMSAAGGSRYSAFTPPALMLLGHICFAANHRLRMEWLLLAIIPLAATAFVFLDHYRNTDTFQRESLADPLSKVKAMTEARSRAAESSDSQLYLIGERMVGNVDPLIYQATPSVIPHAGFDGIDGLLWLYVPTFFYPNRPTMIDAPIIGEQYLQTALIRTSVGSSFTGDWYRRFGWAGVTMGMGLVALILASALRGVVWALRKHPYWGLAAVFLVSTFATKDANMTVSTATWLFLYDFPKYYVMMVMLFFMGRYVAPILGNGMLNAPTHRAPMPSAPPPRGPMPLRLAHQRP